MTRSLRTGGRTLMAETRVDMRPGAKGCGHKREEPDCEWSASGHPQSAGWLITELVLSVK